LMMTSGAIGVLIQESVLGPIAIRISSVRRV
jgi:hypothetical protein